MERLRHLAVALSVVVSLLAPAMVCALPNAHMTAQEHACCQKMKGQCGSMGMPASHSCCRQSIQSDRLAAVAIEPVAVPPLATLAILPSATLFNLPVPTFERVIWPQYSPPTSPPLTVSVLRI